MTALRGGHRAFKRKCAATNHLTGRSVQGQDRPITFGDHTSALAPTASIESVIHRDERCQSRHFALNPNDGRFGKL